MDETTRVDQWLYATITAAPAFAGVQVAQPPAPRDFTYPGVLFNHQGSADVNTGAGADRIMISGLWLVRAVSIADESFAPLQDLADALDTLLHKASGTADGIHVASCTRQQPYRDADLSDGRHYRSLGAIWRIYAHPA
jgi:hypothetical protein